MPFSCPHYSLVTVVVHLLEWGVTRGIFGEVVPDAVRGVLDQLAEGSAARSRGVAWRVAAARAAGKSAGDIADGLVRCAAREGGTDNASCIVLLLGSGT